MVAIRWDFSGADGLLRSPKIMKHLQRYSGYALRIAAGVIWLILSAGGFMIWKWSTAMLKDWVERGQPTSMGNLETIPPKVAWVASLCMMSSAGVFLILGLLWWLGGRLIRLSAAPSCLRSAEIEEMANKPAHDNP
jgi:hypothetical protein